MSANDDYQSTESGAANQTSSDTMDNEYKSRTGQGEIPVVSDNAGVEDPIDADTADSDETLAKDDVDAIDESNIVEERTRGAKPSGGYREPGDEEGLGGPDDGQSRLIGRSS